MGFFTTLISVSRPSAARTLSLWSSCTMSPAKRLYVRGIRTFSWNSINTFCRVRRYTLSWPALFRGESKSAMSSWCEMSGRHSDGSRPCFFSTPRWTSPSSNWNSPLRVLTISNDARSSSTVTSGGCGVSAAASSIAAIAAFVDRAARKRSHKLTGVAVDRSTARRWTSALAFSVDRTAWRDSFALCPKLSCCMLCNTAHSCN
mmetsp:Transcript_35533/g.110047  ORF Transcript_35533/g.110047 Transcript_35533/m.110047 type:complete len:203 (-) Transcript_35533:32-640(-)